MSSLVVEESKSLRIQFPILIRAMTNCAQYCTSELSHSQQGFKSKTFFRVLLMSFHFRFKGDMMVNDGTYDVEGMKSK
jgi:hypothetical protein